VYLTLDAASPIAPGEQLRRQFEALIVGGSLPAGERLPSVRQLARDLGLANATVAKVYRDLERDGLISTGGRGSYVNPLGADGTARRERSLRDAALAFAQSARQLGAGADEAARAVRAAYTASVEQP
jgi:DNA-binding transcriptional regulator YhcF (GntR family)